MRYGAHGRPGRTELQPNDAVVAYATVPTTSEGVVDGAVRITYPTATLDERVRDVWIQLGLLSLAVLAAVVLLGAVIARGSRGRCATWNTRPTGSGTAISRRASTKPTVRRRSGASPERSIAWPGS